MNRIIKCATPNYIEETLAFVETVFTESEGAESGNEVRSIVEEETRKDFPVQFFLPPNIILPLYKTLYYSFLLFPSIILCYTPFQIHKNYISPNNSS